MIKQRATSILLKPCIFFGEGSGIVVCSYFSSFVLLLRSDGNNQNLERYLDFSFPGQGPPTRASQQPSKQEWRERLIFLELHCSLPSNSKT